MSFLARASPESKNPFTNRAVRENPPEVIPSERPLLARVEGPALPPPPLHLAINLTFRNPHLPRQHLQRRFLVKLLLAHYGIQPLSGIYLSGDRSRTLSDQQYDFAFDFAGAFFEHPQHLARAPAHK